MCGDRLFVSSFMESLCRVRNKIMYVFSWRTVYALTRVLCWCLFVIEHQNNTLMSARTVRHWSTCINLYLQHCWLVGQILMLIIYEHPKPHLRVQFVLVKFLTVKVKFNLKSEFTPFGDFPHHNLLPIQARVTKFGPEVQNSLVKIPIIFGWQLTLNFKVKFDLKSRIFWSHHYWKYITTI